MDRSFWEVSYCVIKKWGYIGIASCIAERAFFCGGPPLFFRKLLAQQQRIVAPLWAPKEAYLKNKTSFGVYEGYDLKERFTEPSTHPYRYAFLPRQTSPREKSSYQTYEAPLLSRNLRLVYFCIVSNEKEKKNYEIRCRGPHTRESGRRFPPITLLLAARLIKPSHDTQVTMQYFWNA